MIPLCGRALGPGRSALGLFFLLFAHDEQHHNGDDGHDHQGDPQAHVAGVAGEGAGTGDAQAHGRGAHRAQQRDQFFHLFHLILTVSPFHRRRRGNTYRRRSIVP